MRRNAMTVMLAACAFATACGDDKNDHMGGAGTGGGAGGAGSAGSAGSSGTSGSTGGLQPFTPPTDPGPKGILFTTSGEVLALGGYGFPPAGMDDPAFVDGWEVKFTNMIVTFDHVTISENPDKVPTDESMTDGAVARVDGPWAVDLHKGGPLMGKGGADEQAVAIAALTNQNLKGNAPFDETKRYAFSFDQVAATSMAKNVNLDADGMAAYQEMIEKGYTMMIIGTATWKGTNCTSTVASYDFTKVPKTVNYRLGFKIPTTYINCQNPDNDPANAFAGEEHQRGIAIKPNASVVAQVTFHTDHTYWESFEHDSPAHFDQIAAHYVGMTGTPTARVEDFAGVAFTPFKDGAGTELPWRKCLESFTPPGNGAMSFDTKGVPVSASGDPATAIRDFADYMTYNTSTLGHLNSDGLCFVKRNYPSPP